ncbi:hypothetical protein CBR_g54026 [Chara braunii]|uniref:Uncharacterized protein n=1 Tax=Chara braunii TaxID=69332 RepID=A0A388MBH6_CHABU|nr:hypothetical protein CBR_g54026 [Chara braunii]|eukprot:GBG91931.1 hypothetical protein CBR_g54026 [Chara braunii]
MQFEDDPFSLGNDEIQLPILDSCFSADLDDVPCELLDLALQFLRLVLHDGYEGGPIAEREILNQERYLSKCSFVDLQENVCRNGEHGYLAVYAWRLQCCEGSDCGSEFRVPAHEDAVFILHMFRYEDVARETVVVVELYHLRDAQFGVGGVGGWGLVSEGRNSTRTYDASVNGRISLRVRARFGYLQRSLITLGFELERFGEGVSFEADIGGDSHEQEGDELDLARWILLLCPCSYAVSVMDVITTCVGEVHGKPVEVQELRHRCGDGGGRDFRYSRRVNSDVFRHYRVTADGRLVMKLCMGLGYMEGLLCEVTVFVTKSLDDIPDTVPDGGVDVVANMVGLLTSDLLQEHADNQIDFVEWEAVLEAPLVGRRYMTAVLSTDDGYD